MRYLIYFIIFWAVSALILMGPWQKEYPEVENKVSKTQIQQ